MLICWKLQSNISFRWPFVIFLSRDICSTYDPLLLYLTSVVDIYQYQILVHCCLHMFIFISYVYVVSFYISYNKRKQTSTYKEHGSWHRTQPYLTTRFISWNVLMSFSICTGAVCSQYRFLTTLRTASSTFK